MADSPDSPLSSLASDDFADNMKLEEPAHAAAMSTPGGRMPKRRKIRTSGWDRRMTTHDDMRASSPVSSVSSDTSQELPTSQKTLALIGGTAEDDYTGVARDQVTACQWDGCHVGDLGSMDSLVKHIHEAHIGPKHKRYLCEWMTCSRKGQSHASGYALRAHIRSHTKEKPFYCSLPECDRSFTRSDALTKHMRTVHEAEALRPFEAAAHLNLQAESEKTQSAADEETSGVDGSFPSDIGLDEREEKLPLDYLYRLLRRQVIWAEQEGEELRQNSIVIDQYRQEAWREKEFLLDRLLEIEEQSHKIQGQLSVDKGGSTPSHSPEDGLRSP